MAKSEARLKALQMRRTGCSIGEIARVLGVSKGSASVWCCDIQLTAAQSERLRRNQIKAGHKGRMIGTNANKQKRLTNIAQQKTYAEMAVGTLSRRDTFMLGVALYWGEGTKARGSHTAITNSDPETILFARNWFESIGVSRDLFKPYIFISRTHRHRADVLLDFWSKYLAIPKDQFANIVFLKGTPKKIYENHDSYYGVLALRVRRGMTLKYYISGLIQACKKQAGVAQSVRAIVS